MWGMRLTSIRIRISPTMSMPHIPGRVIDATLVARLHGVCQGHDLLQINHLDSPWHRWVPFHDLFQFGFKRGPLLPFMGLDENFFWCYCLIRAPFVLFLLYTIWVFLILLTCRLVQDLSEWRYSTDDIVQHSQYRLFAYRPSTKPSR